MKRWLPWLLALGLLLGAGTYAESSWRRIRPCMPEIGRKELEPTLGQGVLLGILGGLRTVVADLTWIRSYVLWERKDRPGCEALMRTACALDPHARYFWENTAYAVGYDMAHWEIRRRGGYLKVPAETQDRLYKAYAQRSLLIIEEGMKYSKSKIGLLVTAGQLAEIKLKDNVLAASYYRQASDLPNAPWYAARICAHMLWDNGQKAEAYQWYREHWTRRMKDSEDGFPDDLGELRLMEERLNLPPVARLPRQAGEK